LDEATSNMDSDTEERLQVALESASRGKTTLMIAHRLSTVKTADLILVLHRGNLVEQGSHEELIERGGLYSRLYRYQKAQERAPEFM
jgi:ATP-binding cassette subfamily B protein